MRYYSFCIRNKENVISLRLISENMGLAKETIRKWLISKSDSQEKLDNKSNEMFKRYLEFDSNSLKEKFQQDKINEETYNRKLQETIKKNQEALDRWNKENISLLIKFDNNQYFIEEIEMNTPCILEQRNECEQYDEMTNHFM